MSDSAELSDAEIGINPVAAVYRFQLIETSVISYPRLFEKVGDI
jgi:hypothetical protein